jgi:5,10-methylenetetrahydrofolate reductase
VRSVSSLPVVAQLTTGDDGHTLDGAPPEQFTPVLASLGAEVIGLNCSVGPAVMLETLEQMAERTSARLSAQPNAGKPRDVEGRNIYLSSPEYLASYARRFIATGVRIVGGCCGTTPEHIRHMRVAARLQGASVGSAARARATGIAPAGLPDVDPVPRPDKSRLANALARGRFVTAVELTPPRGYATDVIVEQARLLRIRGVDAVVIPDRVGSGARMSALVVAVLVEQQAGIETVLRYSCRDRHLSAMQADLLGAHAMGLRNLLIVTGEPLRQGDYDDATTVFEVDSIGLTNAVSRFNHGVDIGGQAIGRPTAFHAGARVNAASLSLEDEIRRFQFKVEAGAEFVITEPVFDAADLEGFLARTRSTGVPIIATIRPLESLRHAEWLANEVPTVRVPDALVERMRQAEQRGEETDEGVAIAQELARAIRPMVQGLHVTAPSRRADVALRVLDALVPSGAGA